MKRWIAALLCALLMMIPAMAEGLPDVFATVPPEDGAHPFPTVPPEDGPYPFPTVPADTAPGRGGADANGSITLTVDGKPIELAFDPSPQYSSIAGGLVQASYYAYGADGFTMYELYLIFPDTAKPGMVITPEYAAIIGAECSVVLIVSTNNTELYYSASIMNGAVYPEGSSFSIAIDDVAGADGSMTYTGRLRATLVALDTVSGEPVGTLEIDETPFSFTVRGDSDAAPATPRPSAMPDDMRKV